MKKIILYSLFTGLCLLAACTASTMPGQTAATPQPTPTNFAYFIAPTQDQWVSTGPTAPTAPFGAFRVTLQPTITARPTLPRPTEEAQAKQNLVEVLVYGDSLREGWELYTPDGLIRVNPQSKSAAHSGQAAIAMMPQIERGKLYIVQGKNGKAAYPREQVVGVSLWLFSGDRDLQLHDLALTAVGSNTLTYFDPDDFSVVDKAPYEETFLMWLGFNSAVPAKTWVEVTIPLNEMLYDPEYRYLTGLYLTNRRGFTRTVYVDDVRLIMISDAVPSAPAAPHKQPAE